MTRLLTVQSEDAHRAAYNDPDAMATAVLRIAVEKAARLIRCGEPGYAEFVLTRAGMKAERLLGRTKAPVAGVNVTALAAGHVAPGGAKDAPTQARCLLSEPGTPAPATLPSTRGGAQ